MLPWINQKGLSTAFSFNPHHPKNILRSPAKVGWVSSKKIGFNWRHKITKIIRTDKHFSWQKVGFLWGVKLSSQNKHLNKRLERSATENKADSPHRKMVECNDSLPLIILFLTADLYLVYRCYFSLQILIFLHQILVFLPQILVFLTADWADWYRFRQILFFWLASP